MWADAKQFAEAFVAGGAGEAVHVVTSGSLRDDKACGK